MNLHFELKFWIKTMKLNFEFFFIFYHAEDVFPYSSSEYTYCTHWIFLEVPLLHLFLT